MENNRRENFEDLLKTVADLKSRLDELERRIDEYRSAFGDSLKMPLPEEIPFEQEDFLGDMSELVADGDEIRIILRLPGRGPYPDRRSPLSLEPPLNLRLSLKRRLPLKRRLNRNLMLSLNLRQNRKQPQNRKLSRCRKRMTSRSPFSGKCSVPPLQRSLPDPGLSMKPMPPGPPELS